MASFFYEGALKTTIGRYLRIFAITVYADYKIKADGIDGIQWDSSHMVPINAIKGADYAINPCPDCETYPGQYNNTIKNAFNYQAAWLEKAGRFI
ncbi:hypothetical protein BPOR_0006g00080 [Botrytis porri]|uniref:Uncharacterized protein n=1 Tax=Botrytis porri TaxID=87229 RepID=A0A4Z1L6C8_9HELO|nr:hypothetical protein BPOR_0006g00080 [Botrytis porri]